MTKTYNDIDAVTRLLEEVGRSILTCSISKTENTVLYSSVSSSTCFPTNRKREIWSWPQESASRS